MLQESPAEEEERSSVAELGRLIPMFRVTSLAGHADARHVPSGGAACQIARSRDEAPHWGRVCQ